jgi:hypothetical protein
MKQVRIDYPEALSLVERINQFVEGAPELYGIFVVKDINLLQAYQAGLFLDAKNWTKDRVLSKAPVSLFQQIKLVFVGILLCIATLSAIIWSRLCDVKVVVFTEDKIEGKYKNDFRLEPLYKTLHDTETRYVEVVHTLADRKAFKHLLDRGRPVVYLEVLDFLLAPLVLLDARRASRIIAGLDLASFGSDSDFVHFELVKIISSRRITLARIRLFTAIYRFLNPRSIYAIDDTRHYMELMQAGNLLCVPTYAIQHGHFTKYHTGWRAMTRLPGEVMRPKVLLVWSEYWKKELLRLGTYFKESEIKVAGEPSGTDLLPEDESVKRIGVLIPYEKDAPKAEMYSYIKKLLELPNVEVIFKIRIDEDKQAQLMEYGLENDISQITVIRSLRDVANHVKVVMGTYSTLLYDWVVFGRAVVIPETSLDYGMGMVENGLADIVSRTDDIGHAVIKAATLPRQELLRRRKILLGAGTRLLSDTLRDILKTHA